MYNFNKKQKIILGILGVIVAGFICYYVYAKDESNNTLEVEENYNLRQSTLLSYVGEFGFNTSLSERLLFSNRRKGFMKAVFLAFNKVSPVILPEDYGGII